MAFADEATRRLPTMPAITPAIAETACQISLPEPFTLSSGQIVPLDIGYETWGTLSPQRDNAILISPSFSGHPHASSHTENDSPGWWQGMIGPGCAFDTDRWFILCPALLGGGHGTTGPRSIDPQTGQPYGRDFPVIRLCDIAAAQVLLLDHLQIQRLAAVAGGSLGAMVALDLAIRFPERTARAIVLSGTDQTRPYTAAIRHLGRRAIELGRSTGQELAGLKLAREVGTLFYRSRVDFNQRFSWECAEPPQRHGNTFAVQSYLDHQGNKILGKFDIDSYLTLSLAMDLHNVWAGFSSPEAALDPVSAEFLLVGVEEDSLIPIDEPESLHRRLCAAGKRSSWHPLRSPVGHDAFLVEIERFSRLIASFLGTRRS